MTQAAAPPASSTWRGLSKKVTTSVANVGRSHPFLSLFILGLTVRVMVVMIASGYFSAQGFVLDDTTYHDMARDMALEETGDWDAFTRSLYWRTAAFLVPVTAIYELFGPDKPLAQMFVAVLGAGTSVLSARVAREFLSLPWALAVGLAVALFPSQVFWSSMLMKDAAVWIVLVALALIVAVAGRASGKKLLWAGVGASLLLGVLAFLREHTLVVAAWAMMIASFFGSQSHRVQRIAGAVILGTAIPWFVASVGPAGLALVTDAGSLEERRFHNAEGANTAIIDTTPGGNDSQLTEVEEDLSLLDERIASWEARLERASTAGSEAVSAVKTERIEERIQVLEERAEMLASRKDGLQEPPRADEGLLDPSIRHLPRGLSVMLLEPFPVPFTGGLSLRLARLESLLWYPLLGLAAIGIWRSIHHLRVLAFPLLAGAGILVMYALTEGNVGTAHRHRGEFLWVVVLLGALGATRLLGARAPGGPLRSGE